MWRGKNVFLYLSALFLACLIIVALFAPYFTPHNPNEIDVFSRLSSPNREHYLGTDNLGRDILSRIILAGRVSMTIAFITSISSSLLGTLLGLVAGMYRRLDNLVMRFLDGLMAFPTVVLALTLVAVFGTGLWQEILAITVVFAPRTARIVRGATLALREAGFVEAALVNGGSTWYIAKTHILPNALGPLFVQTTFVFARSILVDAGISFLGLGVPPPTPTWGNMLGDARNHIYNAWWFITFPGLVLVLAISSINVLGDKLRDVLDPRMR